MDEHKELNKMVVMVVKSTGMEVTARQIYTIIQDNSPRLAYEHSFKSLCRLIPTFDELQPVRKSHVVFYKLSK